MKLKSQTIWIITTLSVTALTGLVVLQYYLLHNAYDFRQQAFERNVRAALNSMVQRLETTEAVGTVFRVALNAPRKDKKTMILRVETDSLHRLTSDTTVDVMKASATIGDRMPFWIQNNFIHYSVATPQHVTLRMFNLAGKKDTLLVDSFKEPGKYLVRCGDEDLTNGEIVVKYFSDSTTYTMHAINGSSREIIKDVAVIGKREEIVGRAIDNLSLLERQPIERRVPSSLLDSVIQSTLKKTGIDLPCAYGVLSDRDDSLRMAKPAGYEKELRASVLRDQLFPNDLLFSRNHLVLFFPGQQTYLLKQVGPFLGLTIFFLSIVVFCFGYTIRTIIRQKDFSLRLIDFINNMTHEFKTPISTIAVAAETISRPDIIDQKEKILRYAGVITDENIRMKKQVDKILQMAVIEEGDYELKRTTLDLHSVIRGAVENIALHVEAKGGELTCNLLAQDSLVTADPVHLANIIYNILDNANKYSPGAPHIEIRTSNQGTAIIVEITDRGIGISRVETEKVFEKYYRVSTGDVHDVKGFGLGLSYVKLIVEAHGGTVSLSSEPGIGTTIRLKLPVSAKDVS